MKRHEALHRVLLSWLPLATLVATVPAIVDKIMGDAPNPLPLLATTGMIMSAMTWVVAPLVGRVLASDRFRHHSNDDPFASTTR